MEPWVFRSISEPNWISRSGHPYNPATGRLATVGAFQHSATRNQDRPMQCSHCGLSMSPDDNFCRKCGAAVDVIDVPAVRGEAVPARVWRGAGPALVRGAALVAAGAMLRVVLGQAAKAALGRAELGGARPHSLSPFSSTSEEV